MKNILKAKENLKSRNSPQNSTGKENPSLRFFEIDFLRGVAVLMMVWFHFLWDLNYFRFAEINLYEGFWGAFQKVTAFLFLFLVGVSLSISFNRKKEGFEKRFFFRASRVFFWGLLITAFSVVFFPDQIIFFGILHLIAFSIILSIPLVKRNYFNLAAGAVLFFAPVFFDFSALGIDFLFWLGTGKPLAALDFFPVIPWFGAVLLGLFAGKKLYGNGVPKIKIKNPKNIFTDAASFLGRHSLFIYFIHQPALFTLFFLYKAVLQIA